MLTTRFGSQHNLHQHPQYCWVAGRELDLRKFHEAIEEYGGFEAAVNNKKFARIAIKLGIDLAVATNAAYLLKYAPSRWLLCAQLLESGLCSLQHQPLNYCMCCRSHYQRLLAPYLQEADTAAADTQQTTVLTQSEQAVDAMHIDSDSVERDGSIPADAADTDRGDRAGLDDSTIQQHSAVLTARLQSQPDHPDSEFSDSDDADQTLPMPIDFKATLVDSSGPIPGLEDL